MVQKAVVVVTCSDATFGIRISELKVVPVTVGDYRRGFFFGTRRGGGSGGKGGSVDSNTNKPK